ncbi:MAG: hypothetical protein HC819_08740 [Cyclobacteriaceae bacterium]|nr:hypothetical protein [Cyclobacteriaceae bacterium]
MVDKGLESGIRNDTIFLGLYLGMPAKDFYETCWRLNQEGILMAGAGNSSVLYEMKEDFKSEVEINFYPTFYNDVIYEMPVKFKYKAWAPWNKQYSGDSLQTEVLRQYNAWYGGGFMEIKHKTKGKAFVKVDGNRRISIYRDGSADGTVWVLYTDLSVDKDAKVEMEEETADKNKN